MKKAIYFIILIISSLCVSETVQSQSLVEFAKQQERKVEKLKQQEKSRYNDACRRNTLSAYKEFIRIYPNGRYSKDIKSRIYDCNLWNIAKKADSEEAYQQYLRKSTMKCFEKDAKTALARLEEERQKEADRYAEVCQANTLYQYNEFLRIYPKSRFKEDIQKRIKDCDLWQKAKNTNTIEGYELYLATSKYKCFEKEAKKGIEEIHAYREWQTIRTSNNISSIKDFMQKYPNSTYYKSARKKAHELKGLDFYKSGNLNSAYSHFQKAGGKYAMASENWYIYDECEEFIEYDSLGIYATSSDLEKFLEKYPSGKYTDRVSNRLALKKSSEFTAYSAEYYMLKILHLAKDEPTRKIVRERMETCLREYKKLERKEKRSKRKHRRELNARYDGNHIQFGVEFLDMALNAGDNENGYYNLGLNVKFGNYVAPVQLELGLKLGVLFNISDAYSYDYGYDDSYYSQDTSFEMPIYAKLKVNLFSAGNSKCYIAGMGYYNIIKDDFYRGDFSAGGGFGFAWKHFDYYTLYYKTDFNSYFANNFLGMSMTYYF